MYFCLLSPPTPPPPPPNAPFPLSCFPSLVDLFVFPRSVPTVVIFTKGKVIAGCHYHQFSFSSPVYPWMWQAIKRSSEAVGRAGLLMVKRVMQSFICHPESSVYCRWVSYGDVALPAIFRRKKEEKRSVVLATEERNLSVSRNRFSCLSFLALSLSKLNFSFWLCRFPF